MCPRAVGVRVRVNVVIKQRRLNARWRRHAAPIFLLVAQDATPATAFAVIFGQLVTPTMTNAASTPEMMLTTLSVPLLQIAAVS